MLGRGLPGPDAGGPDDGGPDGGGPDGGGPDYGGPDGAGGAHASTTAATAMPTEATGSIAETAHSRAGAGPVAGCGNRPV